MADGSRLFWGILIGVGTGFAVHRTLKYLEKSEPRRPELSPPPPPPRIPAPRPVTPSPSAPSSAPSAPGTYGPTVEQWRAVIAAQAPDTPIRFALNWLDHESKGLPCSTGFKGERHPDGKYKYEAGIGQQFFEAASREALDHVQVHGVSLAELRAPCKGQEQIRPLTDDEKQKNVRAFLGDIKRFRAKAHAQLAHAGLSWPESTDDFWMLVKLQHGLPCIASSFLAPAASAGRATSFITFQTFVNELSREHYNQFTGASGCRPAMDGYFGAGTALALKNAVKTARGVTGESTFPTS